MALDTKTSRKVPILVFLVFAMVGLSLFSTNATAQEQKDGQSAKNEAQRYVSIDFNDVDISVFIKFISELTGKNFVIDQRVKGKVTIISPSKISVAEAYKVFESVLEVHGFATVETGKLIKIVPSPDARTKSIETRTESKAKGASDDDQVVTQLVPLRFADPEEVKRLFTPMVSKSSVILSYEPTNTLIITDNYSNIARLMNILKTIDVPGVGREISVFTIQNADATKLVTLLENIFKTTQARSTKGKLAELGRDSAAFVADERTNSIILVASEDETNRVRTLIQTLDLETPKGKEKINVYYLQFADAEEMVSVLKDLPKEEKAAAGGAKKEKAVVSDKVSITADKATNSLIITADRDDYATLLEIIKKIDIPRSMVYIEALIMEVNAQKSFDLGTEWVVGDHVDLPNDREGVYGGGFNAGEDTSMNYSIDADGNLIPTLPGGFSLGIFGEAVTIDGLSFPSISALVQAYKKDRDVTILSTPQLLTTDNQEASITVGRNVPFQTTTSTTNNDTYNSFEYRDVGKTLKITPQINTDRMVRLNISLEVSALESTTDFRPTTLKRTVETTVMVKDRGTVVIGGLIDDNFSQTEYKVPCLGDVPGLGWLFKTRAKAGEKSNLFIFITPKVIENSVEATKVKDEKKTNIDQLREKQIKLYQGDRETVDETPHDEPPSEGKDNPDKSDINGIESKPAEQKVEADVEHSDAVYVIQVQSYADEVRAKESVESLTKMGHRAFITEAEVDGKIWYRVQVGDFSDHVSASAGQNALFDQGFKDSILIRKEK